jgi:AbrB family looped-hinge helix DNA binding protein
MGKSERRTVGERGQVTIPKELRKRFGISGGDEVVIYEEGGKLVVDRATTREELAEGYRRRAAQTRELNAELAGVSSESNDLLGEAPDWE